MSINILQQLGVFALAKEERSMTGNLWQDWPVYVLLGVVVFFFIYVIIKGNQGKKEEKETQPSDRVNK